MTPHKAFTDDEFSFGFEDTDGWPGDADTPNAKTLPDDFAESSPPSDEPSNPIRFSGSESDINRFHTDSPVSGARFDTEAERSAHSTGLSGNIWKTDFRDISHKEPTLSRKQAALNRSQYGWQSTVQKKASWPPTSGIAKLMYIIWLTVSVGAAAALMIAHELWVPGIVYIQLIWGSTWFFLTAPPHRTKSFRVFLAADGCVLAVIAILRISFPAAFDYMARELPSIIIPLIFTSLGVLITAVSFAADYYKKQRCLQSVDAVCVEVMGTSTCRPIYSFSYGGKQHLVRTLNRTNAKPTPIAGEIYELRINPEDPEEFYEVKRDGNAGTPLKIFGIIWSVTGLCLCAYMVFTTLQP